MMKQRQFSDTSIFSVFLRFLPTKQKSFGDSYDTRDTGGKEASLNCSLGTSLQSYPFLTDGCFSQKWLSGLRSSLLRRRLLRLIWSVRGLICSLRKSITGCCEEHVDCLILILKQETMILLFI
jgi:hypothetical protein